MIYTYAGNQITSLPNQAICMQGTKYKSLHALSLVGVSQAHRLLAAMLNRKIIQWQLICPGRSVGQCLQGCNMKPLVRFCLSPVFIFTL
jgi:hypothetical protein